MAGGNLSGIGRSPRDSTPVLRWKNDSGATIPAYGVIRLTSYNSTTDTFSAVKPDGEDGFYFVNGPVTVASGGYGESHLWNASRIALTDGAYNDSVGPTAGSWEMTTAGSGFRVFSNPSSGSAAIIQESAGSSMPLIRFQIREADCEARSALAHVLSHGGSIPEAFEIYGETELNEAGETVMSKFVYIYDKNGCYLNESNRNLYGRIGHSAYLYGSPKYPYQPWRAWEIIGICEQQTECEAF